MEVLGAIKTFRDLRESSQAKSLMAANPDYASNQEVIDKIGAVNPDLGNQLRAQMPQAMQLREQRAAAGALWAQRALAAGMRAYQGALNKTDEGGVITDANFAEADKAAQAMYGRFRRAMKERGFMVDNLLPPTWNLKDQDQLQGQYVAITDAMRQPVNVIKPDGSAETMYFLPGEDAQFAAEMKRAGQPVRITKIGSGAEVPGATRTLSDTEAKERGLPGAGTGAKYQLDAKGGVSAVVGPEVVTAEQQKHREAFLSSKPVQRFEAAKIAYNTALDALKLGTRAGDLQALVNNFKLDYPDQAVTEAGLEQLGKAQSLPLEYQAWFNTFTGTDGLLKKQARKELAQAMHGSMEEYQHSVEPRMEAYGDVEKTQNWKPGTITGGLKLFTPEEFQQRRAADYGVAGQSETPPSKPLAPEQAASAQQQYQQQLRLARDPEAFAKAAPEAQQRAFQALHDEDLRAMGKDLSRLSDAQTEKVWSEFKRRGWL